MKKRFVILILSCFAIGGALNAAKVSETQARALAGKFFNVEMPAKPAVMKAMGRNAAMPAYYVFNNPERLGWVVISGDDRARTVLAYGDEAYFDEEEVPECVQDWLNCYVEQIESIGQTQEVEPESTETSILAGSKTKIAPLLFSKWAQGLPFNQDCPYMEDKYSPAGCVAIAMAQIMYYHKSSYGSDAIPSYSFTSNNQTYNREALDSTTFKWSIMNPWYDDASSSTASAQEVQKLVKYCGQAVEMKYGKSSSSATSDRNAFVYYFGYDRYSQQINREDVNATTWENCIYTELAQGRPVYFSARKLNGGHAFVCDGYDGNGLFHINWGWRGNNNGFYALNALTDGNSGGTGAASGEEGYTIKQNIIIGLEPSISSQTDIDFNRVSLYGNRSKSIYAITSESSSYSRSGTSADFTGVALKANYYNTSRQAYTYDLGWGLFDGNGTTISTHTVVSGKVLQPGYYTYPTSSLSLGHGISSSTYYLKPICRLSGTTSWNLARGSNVNYVKATISSSRLTLQVFDDLSVQDLKINSVTVGSIKKVGSPLELKLNVTNNGLTDYNYIYLWVNGTLVSGTTTDIAIGSSGTVTMIHTPSASGNNSIKFTADEQGTKTLYTTSVNISAATTAALTGSVTSSITKYTFKGVASLANTGSSTYNDYIVAKLYKSRPNSGNTGWMDYAQSKTLNLSPGSSTSLTFTFDGLEHGRRYFMNVYYYKNGELVKIAGSSWRETSALDVNEDGVVNAADVTAIYNSILDGDVTYKGYSDVNGDGVVNAADVTTIYNQLLGF